MVDMRASGLAALTAALALSVGAPAMAATITVFDPPGSTGTYADAINGPGAITGWYLDSKSNAHGFVRAADGTFTSFDAAGGTQTQPDSINGKGAIAGYFQGPSFYQSFGRAASGTVTTFYEPGAPAAAPINDREVV